MNPAATVLAKQLRGDIREVEQLRQLSSKLAAERNFETAADLLQWWGRRVQSPPHRAWALAHAGKALAQANHPHGREQAIALLEQALGLHADKWGTLDQLESLLGASGQLRRLPTLIEQQLGLLAADPQQLSETITLTRRLAAVLEDLGDRNRAITAYQNAVQLEPDELGLKSKLAGLLSQRGQPGDSQVAADLYYRLALASEGATEIAYLETALDRDATHVEALSRLEQIVGPAGRGRLIPRWRAFVADNTGPEVDRRLQWLQEARNSRSTAPNAAFLSDPPPMPEAAVQGLSSAPLPRPSAPQRIPRPATDRGPQPTALGHAFRPQPVPPTNGAPQQAAVTSAFHSASYAPSGNNFAPDTNVPHSPITGGAASYHGALEVPRPLSQSPSPQRPGSPPPPPSAMAARPQPSQENHLHVNGHSNGHGTDSHAHGNSHSALPQGIFGATQSSPAPTPQPSSQPTRAPEAYPAPNRFQATAQAVAHSTQPTHAPEPAYAPAVSEALTIPEETSHSAPLHSSATQTSTAHTGPSNGAGQPLAPLDVPTGAAPAPRPSTSRFADDSADEEEQPGARFAVEGLLALGPADTQAPTSKAGSLQLEVVRLRGDCVLDVRTVRWGSRLPGSPYWVRRTKQGFQVHLQRGHLGEKLSAFDYATSSSVEGKVDLLIGQELRLNLEQVQHRLRPRLAQRVVSQGKAPVPYKRYGLLVASALVLHLFGFSSLAAMSALGSNRGPAPPPAEVYAEGAIEIPPPPEPEPIPEPEPEPEPELQELTEAEPEVAPPPRRTRRQRRQRRQRQNPRVAAGRPGAGSANPNQGGGSGNSSAKQLLSALQTPNAGSGESLGDVVSNIDAVKGRSSGSTFKVGGTLAALDGAGNRVNVARGGSRRIGTLGGTAATRGVGRLKATGRPGQVRGRVRGLVAQAKIQGSLSQSQVLDVINRHQHKIQACYEQALVAQPQLSGRVTFSWVIQTNGAVSNVRLSNSTLGSPSAARCMTRVVRQMRFPKPKGGPVPVTFPFAFQQAR